MRPHRQAVREILAPPSVADAIRADLAAGDAGYRAAGEKFMTQKATLSHGEWIPWLTAEGFDARHAQRLMEYAKCDTSVVFADVCHPKPRRRKVSFEVSDPSESSPIPALDINRAIEELTRISEFLTHVSAGAVIQNAARTFHDGGGFDIGVVEALREIRDWVDEVIVGITPFVVNCAHKEA